tara:strand:- start:296 stop:457 length:162 start_codon:yes stop_codon:yes gene_type:complete
MERSVDDDFDNDLKISKLTPPEFPFLVFWIGFHLDFLTNSISTATSFHFSLLE